MIHGAIYTKMEKLADRVIANRMEMLREFESLRERLSHHEHGPLPEDEPLGTLARDAQTHAKAYGVAYAEAVNAHGDHQYAHAAALRAMEIAAGR